MKKIYIILFALAALFASATFVNAQSTRAESTDVPFPANPNIVFSASEWNKTYHIDEESGVAYRKVISKPNTAGVYHIKLDAFVTGREIKTQQAVRSDIVLVLDVSTSMNQTLSGNTTRIRALKDAVSTFIDLIDADDKQNGENNRLGNRIAIVPFGTALFTGNSANRVRNFRALTQAATIKQDVENLTIQNNQGTNAHLGMERALSLVGTGTGDTKSSAQIRTVVLFTDGNPGYYGDWDGADGYSTMPNQYASFTGERHYQNTLSTANSVINYASQIKALSHEDEDPTKTIIVNVFTVSVISNPAPYTQVYLGKTSSNWDEETTNMGSYTMTRSGYNYNYTYTVNGWDSTDIWANGNGNRNTYVDEETGETKNETKYAIQASDAAELEAAFTTIASNIGGGTESLGESEVAAIDVVSASFMLPPGSDASAIKIYTARCTNVLSNGQPEFGVDTLATGRKDKYQPMKKNSAGQLVNDGDPKDVDDNIKVELGTVDGDDSGKQNKITVHGFDYSNNWCGAIEEDGTITGYHGNRVTILIPIKMDPDALGGVGVETNGPGSGIWIGDKNEFPFEDKPVVNLPINIVINKQGLIVGESAKFTILRKTVATDWEEITSVFVTRHSGQGPNDPRTRIEGLPATDKQNREYIYKIKEDNWSWSYTLTSDGEYTTEDAENPFVFTNTKIEEVESLIRHAESKATNTFKTGEGAAYDDSKDNKRTVITVTSSSSSGTETGSK